ncbi:molybdopterin-dependent oxidoreductase [Pararhodobacter sp. CCB-MM2]|uniref:molybdopterin-dependent oxidoreductase n=1 Tax=Pararhodobacter sp. CCB-MM2 TaxID=1786003 RepID=UPI000AE15C69|nr:molybdopterin-dependent oxidoreductase [Pararhodobacter sp. CCB-MM2]
MMMRFIVAVTAAALLGAGAAQADMLPSPTGPVILTISGAVSDTNADGAAALDLAMLDALPQHQSTVETPWYDGEQTFSGPLLSDLMQLVGAEGSELRVIALNDFAASLPWDDISEFNTILASRLNGEELSVRDKGPLFVIYPFHEHPELLNEVYFGRSVWQVARIEVQP